MLRTLFVITVISKVHSHVVPLIYAAPSAVSHQSRIDIKHSPSFISTPIIYSPAAILASHPKEIASETVLTPIVATDTVLTPVALSFFHNLPLARALQHPISIDMVQNSYKNDSENVDQPQSEKEMSTEQTMPTEKMYENVIENSKEPVNNVQEPGENVTYLPSDKLIIHKEDT